MISPDDRQGRRCADPPRRRRRALAGLEQVDVGVDRTTHDASMRSPSENGLLLISCSTPSTAVRMKSCWRAMRSRSGARPRPATRRRGTPRSGGPGVGQRHRAVELLAAGLQAQPRWCPGRRTRHRSRRRRSRRRGAEAGEVDLDVVVDRDPQRLGDRLGEPSGPSMYAQLILPSSPVPAIGTHRSRAMLSSDAPPCVSRRIMIVSLRPPTTSAVSPRNSRRPRVVVDRCSRVSEPTRR